MSEAPRTSNEKTGDEPTLSGEHHTQWPDPPSSGITCAPLAVPLADPNHHMIVWRVTEGDKKYKIYSSFMPPNEQRVNLEDWESLTHPETMRAIDYSRNFLSSNKDDPQDTYDSFKYSRDKHGYLVRTVVPIRPNVQSAWREEVIIERNSIDEIYLRIFPPIMSEEQLTALLTPYIIEEVNTAIKRMKVKEVV